MGMQRMVLVMTSICGIVVTGHGEPKKRRPLVILIGQRAQHFPRDTYRNGILIGRRNETVVRGTAKKPARYQSPTLTISARQIIRTAFTNQVRAAKDYPHARQVWVRGTLFSQIDNASTALEVRCDTFEANPKEWLLQGKISGFYRNEWGRFPVRGEDISVVFNGGEWCLRINNAARAIQPTPQIHATLPP